MAEVGDPLKRRVVVPALPGVEPDVPAPRPVPREKPIPAEPVKEPA